MKRCILFLSLMFLMTGCASMFKSPAVNLPPPRPALDAGDREIMKEQALINSKLAETLYEKGAKAGSEETIILRDGSRVILKYLGYPDQDIDTTNLKHDAKIVNKARDIANDYRESLADYEDDLDANREKLIDKGILHWDFGKIFGFSTTTIVIGVLAMVILPIFFPVILPVVTILWQLLRGGIKAFGIFANLGVVGVKNIVNAIETFRQKHKDTDLGTALDDHLKDNLSDKEKKAIDQFKNHYNI